MEPVSKGALLVWLTSLATAVVAVTSPVHVLLAAVGFLIFADMVTGIMAAVKRGEALTSRALSRSVYKAAAYQIAVLSGFAMEHLLVGDVLPIAKLVAAAIGLVEFKSLAENVRVVTGTNLKGVIDRLTEIGRQPPSGG